jgi:hypothetical protein
MRIVGRRMEGIRTLVLPIVVLMGNSSNFKMEINLTIGSSSHFNLAIKMGWMGRLGSTLMRRGMGSNINGCIRELDSSKSM